MKGSLAEPVRPRPASTVVMLRDGAGGGLEAFMLRRPSRATFAPDALVFPGGAVDRADGGARVLRCAPGFHPAANDGDDGADGGNAAGREVAAFRVAAVRELFEEAGVLLGCHANGAALTSADAAVLRGARRALLAGEGFAAVLERHRLLIAPQVLVEVARFVTPEAAPRRFDARFFAVPAPLDQEPSLHRAEAVDGGWFRPADVLRLAGDGEILLMPPTRAVCADLAACDGVAGAAAQLARRAAMRSRA